MEKFHPVGFSAWVNNYDLIEEIKNSNESDKLFLFACGPFGNILTHKLFEFNKENIYLDCGSALDPLMGLGKTRGYHSQNYHTRNKVCVW